MRFIFALSFCFASCLLIDSSVVTDEEFASEGKPLLQFLVAEVNDDGLIEIEDMVLSPEMFEVLYPLVDHNRNEKNVTKHRRAATADKSRLWPGGRIPYTWGKLDGSKAAVLKAMKEWMDNTCVRFVEKTAQDDSGIEIRSTLPGCHATLGYTKSGYVNLGATCFGSHGVILHELGHILGLTHEHTHPDRDKFLTINWNNIKPKARRIFEVNEKVSSWGIAYDPTSVMHYGDGAALCNGGDCATMTSKMGVKLTQRNTLSRKSDIPIVNKMYCSGGK